MARVPYWNISYGLVIDLLAIPMFAIFIYGLYRYWKRINKGKDRISLGLNISAFKIGPIYIRSFFTIGILGSRIFKKIFAGIAHSCLFWGMALLFVGTALVLLNVLFGLPVFEGEFNRWFMSFTLDISGLAALGGILFLLARRLFPPERLTAEKSRNSFLIIEILIVVIIFSGFLLEGLRIADTGYEPGAVVGNSVAAILGNPEGRLTLHRYLWWAHGLIALAFIAYIPFSPLIHLILVPINAGLAVPVAGPKMGVIDFSAIEDEETDEIPTLGVSKVAEFSRKRLLDFSSCLWCGRCHEVCPATQTGKSLSPKGVMITLSEYLNEESLDDFSFTGSISSDALFCCTTCTACLEACPAAINQPKAIMRLRQHLLMERSEIPEIMGQAHKSLEARQHPFFGTASGPNDWRKGLDVPFFEKGKTENLLWIGCSIIYEERAQKIARSMVNILEKAGVSFGILEETRCTGDPAKQMGNEFLFNEIAQQNVEDFSSLGVKNIITMCPHCYNSFTRHYPLLGGSYEVIPHPVFINRLLEIGALNIKKTTQTICYHDPCYLGRRNSIFQQPRNVLAAVGQPVEMLRTKNNSFCCGGGGGNYWAEEEGTRINQVRAKEAFETNADAIATACPFCLLMMTDGLKKFTEEEKAFDIAELVSLSLERS